MPNTKSQKSNELFDGTLGTRKTDPVEFELKEYSKPIWSRPYPVPKVYEEIFKKEVESLVLLVFIKVANYSEWVAPSFTQPKPKSNRLRFISDFINLNKHLRWKP